MGGYIYLRFFNPVIVTPDAINFISIKPNRIMRRNLILMAKVLQNLSNGILFGDKEVFMKVLNKYIEERMEPLQTYFDNLIKVDDLEDALQVDKYLEHTNSRQNFIQISFNQIFLVHSLLERHKTTVIEENDPMLDILKQLGQPPSQVSKSDNRTVILQLIDRRSTRLSSSLPDSFEKGGFSSPEVSPLYQQAKVLLLSVLRLLPTIPESKGLLDYLQSEKSKAEVQNDTSLADHISNVVSMLNTLASMGLLPKRDTIDDTFNAFLYTIAEEAIERQNRLQNMDKRNKMVSQAIKNITTHHDYLLSRLEMYKLYLENVRKGQSQEGIKKEKTEKKKEAVIVKFSHPELEEMRVITKVNIPLDKTKKDLLKKCTYHFTMVSPGKFQVEVHLKKGVDWSVLNKPIELVLEELLRMQEHGKTDLDLDLVTLNVNLLIHLLNTRFITKKK